MINSEIQSNKILQTLANIKDINPTLNLRLVSLAETYEQAQENFNKYYSFSVMQAIKDAGVKIVVGNSQDYNSPNFFHSDTLGYLIAQDLKSHEGMAWAALCGSLGVTTSLAKSSIAKFIVRL